MHYALNPRTFVFSHYFHSGLRIAIGVIGLAFLTMHWVSLPAAMTVALGALCTSLMDLPGPLRHKFNEMAASVIVCSAVTLIVGLCTPFPLLLTGMILLLTFLASMMLVYGRKAMPLQFAALFIMSLSMENAVSAHQALLNGALFFGGAAAYLVYAMLVAGFTQHRTRQQVLAESLYELARYTDIKADFYDVRKELGKQFNELVRQQIRLAEKQQASRDMILRGNLDPADASLLHVHYGMFDLYELVLSTHTDYVQLRRHFADGGVLPVLHELVRKAARDIESIAYAVTRNRASRTETSYEQELHAIEAELHRLEHAAPAADSGEALAVLRGAYNKLCAVIDMIGQLHRATEAQTAPPPTVSDTDMTPFLTQQRYRLRSLVSSMRWTSPVFRFALRVTMAMAVGLLVAEHLPYQAHDYWIALTIAVILKPSFSMTRQRRADRVIGTLIGCVLTALILRFVHSPAILLGFLFVATAAAPTFLSIKYRYTAVAASVQILLLLGLTVPHASQAIVERLLDTFIGATIATFFSYLLPSWEFNALPQLVRAVLKANRDYIGASNDLLQGRSADDFLYRLYRKRFMDSLAGLSSALARMLDEPADRKQIAEEINRFIIQNYLVVAHLAAIRLLLRRDREQLPHETINAVLQETCDQLNETLVRAQQAWRPGAPAGALQVTSAAPFDKDATSQNLPADRAGEVAWAGWTPLIRRIELLHDDAQQIAVCSRLISEQLAGGSAGAG